MGRLPRRWAISFLVIFLQPSAPWIYAAIRKALQLTVIQAHAADVSK
ncbi:hypothetical protein [Nocardia abscessus]|nr:hypothetical protein [Nocardia abscessus]